MKKRTKFIRAKIIRIIYSLKQKDFSVKRKHRKISTEDNSGLIE